jgi:hypothetical protein
MDYEKKYPITQQPGDFILVQWERGYKYVEVFFKDRMIGSVEGAGKLRRGVVLQDEQLGNVELKLSEKPMILDVIIDGYHSPVNQMHPKKQLARLSAFFWIIMTFAVIGALLEGLSLGFAMDMSVGTIVTAINILIITAYIIAAIFVGKGQAWGYYMGFSVFSLLTVLTIISVLATNMSGAILIGLLIRFAFLGVLIYNMKTANSALKHARFGKNMNDQLLDA